MIRFLKDRIQGKVPWTGKRSPLWRKVRAEHLEQYPTCAACGGTKKLEVHHILPLHLYPEYELVPMNLITLCESKKKGVNCHLLFGHLGNFRKFNTMVKRDAEVWRKRLS